VSAQTIYDQTFTTVYQVISFVCESNRHKISGARPRRPTDRLTQTQGKYNYGWNPKRGLLAMTDINTPLCCLSVL